MMIMIMIMMEDLSLHATIFSRAAIPDHTTGATRRVLPQLHRGDLESEAEVRRPAQHTYVPEHTRQNSSIAIQQWQAAAATGTVSSVSGLRLCSRYYLMLGGWDRSILAHTTAASTQFEQQEELRIREVGHQRPRMNHRDLPTTWLRPSFVYLRIQHALTYKFSPRSRSNVGGGAGDTYLLCIARPHRPSALSRPLFALNTTANVPYPRHHPARRRILYVDRPTRLLYTARITNQGTADPDVLRRYI
ncbi:hypothetical protein F4779DRAFT_487558 [Xylariaceae sp. FL0662B]|nr:hypothetical protein F4779DRAFT_487558 [Xylariaceae sp. FL0662B]